MESLDEVPCPEILAVPWVLVPVVVTAMVLTLTPDEVSLKCSTPQRL